MGSNNIRAIRRFNRRVLYKTLISLKSEGIVRLYGLPIIDREDRWKTAEFLSQRGYRGGWNVVKWNYFGFLRGSDVAVTFAGVNLKETKLVAKRIVEALREAGLSVYWDGTVRGKILVDLEKQELLKGFPKVVVDVFNSTIESSRQRATA